MNSNIKYLVYGGGIISKSDGQPHDISAEQVATLYGVKPSECIFISWRDYVEGNNNKLRGYTKSFIHSLVVLQPRSDGDYDIEKRKKEQQK